MGVNEKDDDEYEADVASLTAALESKVNVTESDTNDEQDQTQEKASGQSPPKAAAAATTTTIEAAPAALHAIAQWLHDAQSILVLTGAGVSVAAGIPDFRTPGTGLYDNLSKYNLPYAEAVFDIDYYPRHPQAFVQLANELWPDPNTIAAPKPTLTHCFVALLAEKGKLLRNYSQVK